MADEPLSGTALMMGMEERRLEARDRAVAMSVAGEAVDRFFDPERIEDMRDVRRQITRAAELAAYTAIQKERELHAGDMAALASFAESRLTETMLRPPGPIVVGKPDAPTT